MKVTADLMRARYQNRQKQQQLEQKEKEAKRELAKLAVTERDKNKLYEKCLAAIQKSEECCAQIEVCGEHGSYESYWSAFMIAEKLRKDGGFEVKVCRIDHEYIEGDAWPLDILSEVYSIRSFEGGYGCVLKVMW